jgi:hypothetical protein
MAILYSPLQFYEKQIDELQNRFAIAQLKDGFDSIHASVNFN